MSVNDQLPEDIPKPDELPETEVTRPKPREEILRPKPEARKELEPQ